jgi:hypothetical protein
MQRDAGIGRMQGCRIQGVNVRCLGQQRHPVAPAQKTAPAAGGMPVAIIGCCRSRTDNENMGPDHSKRMMDSMRAMDWVES